MQPPPPLQPPLASGRCRLLSCFSDGIYLWARTLWVLINYLFFLPVMLPSEIRKLLTDPPSERVSWCLETSLLRLPSRGWISFPTSFLSFYLLYFVLPYFEDNGLPFWVPDVLCQHSEVVLWNLLSIQMFFRWICGWESGLPVLLLFHLRTTPLNVFSYKSFSEFGISVIVTS